MMKRIFILSSVLLFLLVGCKEIVSPDIVQVSHNGNTLWVTNRQGKELMTVGQVQRRIIQRQSFPTAINDLMLDTRGRLWVVCDGADGLLCELNPYDITVYSRTPMGNTPSAVAFSEASGTLWVTQRYLNEIWEIDPDSKEVRSRLSVGREPVDVIPVRGGSMLLVVNNLPAMAATDFPVASHIDVVDTKKGEVVKHIMLPNGSADCRAIVTDGEMAYLTHLVGRYQLPTNQVDRGWMSTNAMSVINLENIELETTILLDTPQRGAANPATIDISPDGSTIMVALSGSHELAVIDRNGLIERIQKAGRGEATVPSIDKWEDIPNDAGFLYGLREFIPTGGKGPLSFDFYGDGVVVANYYTGDICVLDEAGKPQESFVLGAALTSTKQGLGEMYFHDATLCFQGWQSCASCHPNQARVDGLNWDLVNDGVGNPKNTKSLLYSHHTAPSMITGIRKDAETAVRSGLKYILFADTSDDIPQAMDVYLKNLKAVPSPYLVNGELSEAALRGEVSFNKYCASCHCGEYYTDQKAYSVSWAKPKDNVPMDVPALSEIWRTAPYLYDGRSYSIREMLDIHGPQEQLSSGQLDDLAQYVLSL